MIIALGPFKGGGRLRYWEDDTGAGHGAPETLPPDVAKELRILRKLQVFDGARAHETTLFRGKRTTVTWYSVKDSWRDDVWSKDDALRL